MSNQLTPDYLIIGHILKDNIPGGAMLGGTGSYASLTARKLGAQTAVFTSYGPDLPSLAPLNGIEIEKLTSEQSTTFENIYQNGARTQKWFGDSTPLSFESLPAKWRAVPIIHLAPMAQEMSPAMCSHFPDSLVCVTMQGWLRGRDEEHTVIYQPHPDLEAWLSHIDILVISLADVDGDEEMCAHYLNSVRLGVETLGPQGCRIFHQGNTIHVPVDPIEEADPTGAGDIFAAAFFIRYYQTQNMIKAAQFANACASLSVKGTGLESIPNLAEIVTREKELYG